MNAASPLTIAHVTGESGFSGGEVQLFLLMEGLRERGHQNVLIAPPNGRGIQEAKSRGFSFLEVPMRHSVSLPAVIRLKSALATAAPNIVHAHTGRADGLGSIVTAWLDLPCISTRRMDRRVKRTRYTRWMYHRVFDRTVAISNAVATRLRDGRVPEERIRVIWSAIDPKAMLPQRSHAGVRAEMGSRSDDLVTLCLASLDTRKGLDVLLEAFAKLSQQRAARGVHPRAVLWLAGEGPERGALEVRKSDLGLGDAVRFLGQRNDAADLLHACDVFVLPSRLEGLGVAALEAMAAERPVVASAVGGLRDIIAHDETGLLVPPEEPEALAQALSVLLSDKALRERLGSAGPARIRARHLPDHMTAAYERLYVEILGERSH